MELYASTPPLETIRSVISYAASHGKDGSKRQLMVLDIRRAYFNAPAQRPVYVEIPPEDWEVGDEQKCARLLYSIYGTRDAARNWENELRYVFAKLGARRGKSTPCAQCLSYQGRQIRVAVHGDDIVCAGSPED